MYEEKIQELYEKLTAKLSAEADRVKTDIPFIPIQ